MSRADAAQDSWVGYTFANDWVIDKKYTCAEYRKLYKEMTGEESLTKNAHYLCHNELCGVETYMERTVIKRAMDNDTQVMSKCRGCTGLSEKCHYATKVRVKRLTKTPDRSSKIQVGETYGLFTVKEVKPSGNYSDHQCRALVECILCGAEQESRFDTILENTLNCDCFRIASNGAMRIKYYLDNNNTLYRMEQTFNDLVGVGNGLLRYDFAILDNNKNIIQLIEYDGEQHFRPVNKFGGEEAFKIRQQHDAIKNEYAKQHAIPLLRIKYCDDIEDVLTNNLIKIK